MGTPGSCAGGDDDEDGFVLFTSQSYVRQSQPAISPSFAAGLSSGPEEEPTTTPSQDSRVSERGSCSIGSWARQSKEWNFESVGMQQMQKGWSATVSRARAGRNDRPAHASSAHVYLLLCYAALPGADCVRCLLLPLLCCCGLLAGAAAEPFTWHHHNRQHGV